MTTPAQPAAAPAPVATPGTAAPAVVPPSAAAPAGPAVPSPSEAASAVAVRLRKAERERDEARKTHEAGKGDLDLIKRLRDPATRFTALADAGISYEEWTQHQLAGLKDEEPPIKLPADVEAKLKKIDEMEAKLGAKEKSEAEARTALEHRNLIDAAKGFTERNAANYPALNALGAHEALATEYQAALAAYEQEAGEPPTAEDAVKIATATATRIEASYKESVERNLTAVAATDWGKTLLAKIVGLPATKTDAADGGTAQPRANGFGARTLTNQDAASPSAPVNYGTMSEHEKRERAKARARQAGSTQ